jgi:hypothetical protein
MRCFQAGTDLVLVVLANVAIALGAALLPQYAIIFFTAAVAYYHATTSLLEPLCKWSKYYYVAYAVGGIISVFLYAYAWDKAIEYSALDDRVVFGRVVSPGEYALWMFLQILSIPFTALTMLTAYTFALKKLQPFKKYPALPTSESRLGRFIEMLGEADDICNAEVPLHDKMYRLICHGDTSTADHLSDHALVVAAYYVMFRRYDLKLAEDLLHVLSGRNLFPDAKEAVEVLKAAHKAMTTCDVNSVCKVATMYTWSTLFKELVALHFAYDAEAVEKLKCKTVKAFIQYEVYTIGKRWHIEYKPDPLLYFTFHATDRARPLPHCRPQV